MSNQILNLPFKEYSSTLSRYSDNDQLQQKQYKAILESELGQAFYQREFSTIDDAALGPLNANLPVYNEKKNVRIADKNVDVYKTFWQYKQPGGTIFTDWNSAGLAAIKEDMAVKDLPLYNSIQDPALVLSNTNNVRNNLLNYGKEYLTTTNMLNAEAFDNGVSYESGTSPYRTGTRYEMDQIIHGNFGEGKEDGDLYARQIKELRVDNPINYANNSISSWQYANYAFVIPNENMEIFHQQLKFGIFDLDSLKLTGQSCLTKNFHMTPQGFNSAVDTLNDQGNFPPVSNPDYYTPGINYFNNTQDPRAPNAPSGTNLYCSANTNYVTMPKNNLPKLKGLDTSFQVSPGNNSITLGVVMSPNMKNFIQNDLFEFNKSLIVMQIYEQEINNARNFPGTPVPQIVRDIERKYSHLFNKNNDINFEYYSQLSEENKYTWVFNQQRNFLSIYQGHPELEIFIKHLSIFKFGGNNVNKPTEKGLVRLRELSKTDIPIEEPGCFLLLPTMLSEDLFPVRQELPNKYPNNFTGNVSEINERIKDEAVKKAMKNNTPINYTPIVNHERNECITTDNYELNATNCAFRDRSEKWIQKPNPNFVPNMFNDANNLNNDIDNLYNKYGGANPYNAPLGF